MTKGKFGLSSEELKSKEWTMADDSGGEEVQRARVVRLLQLG